MPSCQAGAGGGAEERYWVHLCYRSGELNEAGSSAETLPTQQGGVGCRVVA